jgi:4-amino-4-deoxychorismate lyase
MNVLVNGEPATTIDVMDRGLQYGDGLFETIAMRKGRPRLLAYHLERLAEGCNRLGIASPDAAVLGREIAKTATAPDCVVKVIVTRGSSGRGYRPPTNAAPTRIVAAFPWPVLAGERTPDGARLRFCDTRLSSNTRLAGLKHLGRLEQVLARGEWDDEDIAEGLMLDEAGMLVCGTQSNLFVLAGEELLTPRVDRCGVAGVMRRAVLEWASRRGMAAREVAMRPQDLFAAAEVFVTNALIGALPVRELDGRVLGRGTIAVEFNRWLAQV